MIDVQEQNFLSSDTRLDHSVTEVQRSSCVISTNQMQNENDMPHDKACPVLRAGHVRFLWVFTGFLTVFLCDIVGCCVTQTFL